MGYFRNGQDYMRLTPLIPSYYQKMFRKPILLLLILLIHLTLPFIHSCRMNPAPVSVISGFDNLFAPANGDTTFTFSDGGETYGSFQLKAYVSIAILQTPQGGGIQKGSTNLDTAPESGYIVSEEVGYYYYYMITDVTPHYAKLFIHTVTQDQTGITIEFNWWLQTNDGDRNFQ